MPYLTPDDLPEERDCRALLIPANADWLAIVSGALTELVKVYNWEQGGSVTVSDAVQAMQDMIDQYYLGCIGECELPEGGAIIRVSPDGTLEQLVDGEWVAPTGDYEIPPTPAREEPTAEERRCLAAANAAATLKVFYEDVADAWAHSLSVADAQVQLTATIVGAVGLVFGLISGSVIAFAGAIWAAAYELVEFVTADVWTSGFDQELQCVLYDCTSDDAGVVHFDYNCVLEALAHRVDIFDPTISELRLFGQVAWLLSQIGVEGLDAAGATTAVETAECECEWCIEWLPEHGTDWELVAFSGVTATYEGGKFVGASTGGGSSAGGVLLKALLEVTGTVTHFEISFEWLKTVADTTTNGVGLYVDNVQVVGVNMTAGLHESSIGVDGTWTDAEFQILGGVNWSNGAFNITHIQMRGTGLKPDLGQECF